jgi:hypothetical protein
MGVLSPICSVPDLGKRQFKDRLNLMWARAQTRVESSRRVERMTTEMMTAETRVAERS